MSKVAVLTNDLQYDLVNKNQERIDAVAEATPSFSGFLKDMRQRGHHVLHLQLINKADDPVAERYEGGRLPAQKGTQGAEILPVFLDDTDILVEKNKDSGFYETDLHERLQALGVETVIVTGMQGQICVQTTAADAFFRGYNVWVPSDCVVSAQEHDKVRALDWLDGYCATVAPSDEIVRVLDADGDLPRKVFRTP
ncbi:isochorismatase [Streptomyces sp. CB01635]|jgi:nicotinamidase-related amidase|uniref:Putative N-carbomoyl-sarcosine amidase n=1 Tax=Streptomyces atroolivaceus TaxID=66869 RepID=Q8GGQ8_STRAZ|nr:MULTISPECIES: isochorismatase family cysteine hydrolase [unclassified Streptomyces]AAN85507.1 putative N-carbomoyl-sarcosine amidase [Streptomyces atroolivaceus]PJN08540.1 isochorismatase [Streptomyces sp. CB01635]WSE11680.1 cysteine hydrolase [Streptomyces sp. NBC_01445]